VQWISDAEIAETTYTAFQSRRESERITLRLIVRRVKDNNVVADQGELFTAWRCHAFITDSTLHLVHAEKQHRDHAIIEQVHADLKDVDAPRGTLAGGESRCHTGYTGHFSLIGTYSRLSSRGRCAGPLWRWENGAFVRDADMSVML
jgi:hypothetical protein